MHFTIISIMPLCNVLQVVKLCVYTHRMGIVMYLGTARTLLPMYEARWTHDDGLRHGCGLYC